jgi:hypothetical protein
MNVQIKSVARVPNVSTSLYAIIVGDIGITLYNVHGDNTVSGEWIEGDYSTLMPLIEYNYFGVKAQQFPAN